MISDWFDSPFVSHVDIGSHQLYSTAVHLVKSGLVDMISRVSLKREGFFFSTKQTNILKNVRYPELIQEHFFEHLIA